MVVSSLRRVSFRRMAISRQAGRARLWQSGPVFVVFILCAVASAQAAAGQVRLAVATNFAAAVQDIAAAFEAATDHTVVLSFGSTGQLFAQITQGAPYDVFIAADQVRPRKAVEDGLGIAGSRFTYAAGRLAFYSATPGLVPGEDLLRAGSFDKIAIANPVTAPYGEAAIEVMDALGVGDRLAAKLVRGTDVGQVFQFIATGNAEVGFVALSQVVDREDGSFWVVPEELHTPIAQDAILLTEAAGNDAAVAFLAFLRGPEARTIKESYGYGAGD